MFHLTLGRVKRQITNKGQMLRGKSALKTFSTPSPWQTPPTSCPVTTEHTQKRFEYKYRYKFGSKNSTKNENNKFCWSESRLCNFSLFDVLGGARPSVAAMYIKLAISCSPSSLLDV